ncbi:MAG: GTP cyclohydrolase I FolE2, partial [Spirochaetales bacterium]|nr:GTP cyclohydrolase I FolE2 [Spirochaetales bacterium]
MIDVQSRRDEREIEIQKVGVKHVRYPITVLDKRNRTQATVATINLYADLPHEFKGTHMSRFIEVVNQYYVDISMHNFMDMLEEIRSSLDARRAYAEVSFPYFVEKKAPVSGERSMMGYTCEYIGEVGDHKRHFYVGVEVPITTVCPCSLEISDRGAHNQRGIVRVKLLFRKFFWIEDLISLVEQSGSSEVYTLLKREDEKHITERAFDHPLFVEDVVREVTQ